MSEQAKGVIIGILLCLAILGIAERVKNIVVSGVKRRETSSIKKLEDMFK